MEKYVLLSRNYLIKNNNEVEALDHYIRFKLYHFIFFYNCTAVGINEKKV